MQAPAHRCLRPLVALVAIAAVIGCTAGVEDEPAITYHRDVKPILEARCVQCHTAGQIGPMALDSYEAAAPVAALVAEVTAERRMPPFLADPECADYSYNPRLTDAQIDVLSEWADLDAPEGDPATTEPPAVGIEELRFDGPELLPDVTLMMPEPYQPTLALGEDDYRCFVIDWPWEEPVYVTGFGTSPGNPRLVHHVIAYLIRPQDVEQIRGYDDEDPGPGYSCFGSPGTNRTRWVGAWAPGGVPSAYPDGTGLLVEPGSVIALQVHYHVSNGTGTDQTGVDIMVADSVEREALILPFTNPTWLSGDNMLIPGGDPDVVHSWTVEVGAGDDDPQPFLIHSSNMHMHTRGTTAALWIDRAGGQRECLLDIPKWDFEWQLSYPYVEPIVVNPDDELGIECHWDNSGALEDHHATDDEADEPHEHEVPPDIHWGDGTHDEMCLGVFYVSEL